MNKEYRCYRALYAFLRVVLYPFFRIRAVGRENIPPGAAMICPNHTSFWDPIFLAIGAGIKNHLRFMGKAELFKVPLLGRIYTAVGSFAVARGKSDITAVRTAMALLKNGDKVVIFPEGTRVRNGNTVAAKQGAVRIADQVGVPVVPVYISAKKRLFRRSYVIFGEPYFVNPEKAKLSGEEYLTRAEALMETIRALGKKAEGT